MRIEEMIKGGKCIIVDVRTTAEFEAAHAPGSINIPLHEIPDRLEEIKALNSPLVLCCLSGNRSGQAKNYLSQLDIECHNGGSWFEINYIQKSA